jgi:hypothetical protein
VTRSTWVRSGKRRRGKFRPVAWPSSFVGRRASRILHTAIVRASTGTSRTQAERDGVFSWQPAVAGRCWVAHQPLAVAGNRV